MQFRRSSRGPISVPMQVFKPVRALAIVVLGVVLVAGIAITLQRGKHAAEESAISSFASRAAFTARVSAGAVSQFPKGRGRQLVAPAALPRLARFAHGYLQDAPAVAGAEAYLLNARGRVVASGASARPGQALRDAALVAALQTATSGRYGSRRFVSRPVGRTGWHVVFSAPEAKIAAQAHTGAGAGWASLTGLIGTLVALVGMALHAVRRTTALSEAREREAMAVERERAASELARERLHDGLTGLPNRALFLDRTQHALAALTRRNRPVVVMFVDVDRFKRVNDSLGHALGDETIREVARRLHRTVRPMDTVMPPWPRSRSGWAGSSSMTCSARPDGRPRGSLRPASSPDCCPGDRAARPARGHHERGRRARPRPRAHRCVGVLLRPAWRGGGHPDGRRRSGAAVHGHRAADPARAARAGVHGQDQQRGRPRPRVLVRAARTARSRCCTRASSPGWPKATCSGPSSTSVPRRAPARRWAGP